MQFYPRLVFILITRDSMIEAVTKYSERSTQAEEIMGNMEAKFKKKYL